MELPLIYLFFSTISVKILYFPEEVGLYLLCVIYCDTCYVFVDVAVFPALLCYALVGRSVEAVSVRVCKRLHY